VIFFNLYSVASDLISCAGLVENSLLMSSLIPAEFFVACAVCEVLTFTLLL